MQTRAPRCQAGTGKGVLLCLHAPKRTLHPGPGHTPSPDPGHRLGHRELFESQTYERRVLCGHRAPREGLQWQLVGWTGGPRECHEQVWCSELCWPTPVPPLPSHPSRPGPGPRPALLPCVSGNREDTSFSAAPRGTPVSVWGLRVCTQQHEELLAWRVPIGPSQSLPSSLKRRDLGGGEQGPASQGPAWPAAPVPAICTARCGEARVLARGRLVLSRIQDVANWINGGIPVARAP